MASYATVLAGSIWQGGGGGGGGGGGFFLKNLLKMWQFRVEIKHYSVAYFDRITAFKVL